MQVRQVRRQNGSCSLFFHKTVANSVPFVSSSAKSKHSTCCMELKVPLLISGAWLTCAFSSMSTGTPDILRSSLHTFCRVSALATHCMRPALSLRGKTSKRTTRRCRLAASGLDRNSELTSVNCVGNQYDTRSRREASLPFEHIAHLTADLPLA